MEPSVLPDELADPICEVLAQAPGVGSAYLQIMIINDEAKSYLLVLDGPKDDKLFSAVAKAARPYLMGRREEDRPEHHHVHLSAGSAGHAAAVSRSTARASVASWTRTTTNNPVCT